MIFKNTPFEPFEQDWKRAISITWSAIADDLEVAAEAGDFKLTKSSATEVVLDANHVEVHGRMPAEALEAWKKMIQDYPRWRARLNRLACSVVGQYV